MTNLEIDPPGHIAVAAAPGTAGAITSKKTGPFPYITRMTSTR